MCALPVDEVAEDETVHRHRSSGKYTIDSLDSSAYLVILRPLDTVCPAVLPERELVCGSPIRDHDGGRHDAEHQRLARRRAAVSKARLVTPPPALPVKDVFVCPEGIDGDRIAYENCAQSDENGDYELEGLTPGEVRLAASDPRPGYSGQIYSNRYELLEADPLHVTEGAAPHGRISSLGAAA